MIFLIVLLSFFVMQTSFAAEAPRVDASELNIVRLITAGPGDDMSAMPATDMRPRSRSGSGSDSDAKGGRPRAKSSLEALEALEAMHNNHRMMNTAGRRQSSRRERQQAMATGQMDETEAALLNVLKHLGIAQIKLAGINAKLLTTHDSKLATIAYETSQIVNQVNQMRTRLLQPRTGAAPIHRPRSLSNGAVPLDLSDVKKGAGDAKEPVVSDGAGLPVKALAKTGAAAESSDSDW